MSQKDGAKISTPGNAELTQLRVWLKEFELRKGRPLRVLHIGNIAGNGYLNTKFLRSVGVEADLVSRDYSHVMSLPEWEDVELLHTHGDDNNPKFDERDVQGYERPDWFIQGPFLLCVEMVQSRYGINGSIWHRFLVKVIRPRKAITATMGNRVRYALFLALSHPRQFLSRVYLQFRRAVKARNIAPKWLQQTVKAWESRPLVQKILFNKKNHIMKLSKKICALFQQRFPDRPDKLTPAEVANMSVDAPQYKKMFAPYDIVQAYATEPIGALLSGKRPYVTFEHGTLRHFTTEDDPLHRLTALAYREADHTFITNGDCLSYAERLGIDHYSPIIHPVDVEQHRQDFSKDAQRIREELGAELLIFCPVRHDYEIKGTDKAIEALPLIKEKTERRVVMIMSAWGEQVEESRAKIEALGCAENVVWRDSMCRISMIKHIQASDIVFDQFVLPVFGSTAPQTIAAGKPVVSSYVPEETKWLIPEPAPIVSAFSAKEIADRVIETLDPKWRADYKVRARQWIDTYHSPQNAIIDQLRVYRDVLERYGPTPKRQISS